MKRFRGILAASLLCAACFVFLTRTANGQAAYGTIIGTASDPSGAGVPNAQVTATDTEKGVSQTTTSNDSVNYTLSNLLPGAAKNPWQHGQTENPQGGIQIATNGQLFSGTNFMIDGMDNNDPVLGIIVINPAIDSVQGFNATTSNFDAEFSQAGGVVIQVETKSGTNQIHGSGFEFYRNNIFQARSEERRVGK